MVNHNGNCGRKDGSSKYVTVCLRIGHMTNVSVQKGPWAPSLKMYIVHTLHSLYPPPPQQHTHTHTQPYDYMFIPHGLADDKLIV